MAGVGGSPLSNPGQGPIAPWGPARAPIAPSVPDRAPIAPSGPDQGVIALSLLALLIKLLGGILSKTGGEVGPGTGSARILGGCGAYFLPVGVQLEAGATASHSARVCKKKSCPQKAVAPVRMFRNPRKKARNTSSSHTAPLTAAMISGHPEGSISKASGPAGRAGSSEKKQRPRPSVDFRAKKTQGIAFWGRF